MFFVFLMGLNDSYDHIIGQILIAEPFPSIDKVCSLILQEEKHKNIGHGINVMVEPTTLYASNGSNPNFCPSFRPTQSQGYNGGKKGEFKKERLVCTYCGLIRHIADKCYKLHGYPPGYKPKGNASMANQVSGAFHSRNSDGSDGSFGQARHCFINGSSAYGASQLGVIAFGMQPHAMVVPS